MKKVTSPKQESDLPPKLGAPAQRALAGAGIHRLEQLTRFSEKEIKQLHGVGPNALATLRQALTARGLSFSPMGKAGSGKGVERFDQVAEKTNGGSMKKMDSKDDMTASQQIDKFIKELADWRGKRIAQFRDLILKTAPEVTEEWKWGVPVWAYKGNVVASGVFKDHVKLNFFKGASLKDPKHLFNAGLDAKATRAIDISEADDIDESALKELVRAAVDYNMSGRRKK